MRDEGPLVDGVASGVDEEEWEDDGPRWINTLGKGVRDEREREREGGAEWWLTG